MSWETGIKRSFSISIRQDERTKAVPPSLSSCLWIVCSSVGFFIAFYAIYLKIPFAYLIVGLPFLCDGGISIFKITVGRLTKKKIIPFKNITTPLHDELRKNRGFNVRKVWTVLVLCTLAIDVVYVGITLILHLFR